MRHSITRIFVADSLMLSGKCESKTPNQFDPIQHVFKLGNARNRSLSPFSAFSSSWGKYVPAPLKHHEAVLSH